MHRKPFLMVLAALFLPLNGCGTGDYRRISLASDMAPGDVAHYRELASKSLGKPLEDFAGGLPLLFVPVLLLRLRETAADQVEAGAYHYHFEDDLFFLLVLARYLETANFDAAGKNLTYESFSSYILGILSLTHGHRALPAGGYAPTSGFSFLWGLFATQRTPYGRCWRIFWIPIVSARAEPGAA